MESLSGLKSPFKALTALIIIGRVDVACCISDHTHSNATLHVDSKPDARHELMDDWVILPDYDEWQQFLWK